ncbi:hypothetical protein [Staphylococcus petrasii]|uniref:hypothetical protein n=1 Tax=Staphylococcus petrasii TaxID=1276936 RepID=UPI000DFD952B|nr:hypothetical protein [Staphylococcus petrasii]SUM58901.1 Uncharacterised protein [Staphylococcus petrasii]
MEISKPSSYDKESLKSCGNAIKKLHDDHHKLRKRNEIKKSKKEVEVQDNQLKFDI